MLFCGHYSIRYDGASFAFPKTRHSLTNVIASIRRIIILVLVVVV